MENKKKLDTCKDCQKTSKCFQYLYPDELEFISKKKTQLEYVAGENIFKQGAFAPHVMYVVDGMVKLYLQAGSNKQINIRLLTSGDFLAFSTIFGEAVYNYSAMAIKQTTICMIEKDALKQLLTKNADFAMRITSKNCKNEGILLEKIKNISYKQMRGKLASTLLYLSAEPFLKQDVFNYLNRQEIADFASISTESAIKFLKEFEKEGIIKLSGRNITINNYDLLSEISRRG